MKKMFLALVFITQGVVMCSASSLSNHEDKSNLHQVKDTVIYLKKFAEFIEIRKQLDKKGYGYFFESGRFLSGETWGKPSKAKVTYIAHAKDSIGLIHKLTTKTSTDL